MHSTTTDINDNELWKCKIMVQKLALYLKRHYWEVMSRHARELPWLHLPLKMGEYKFEGVSQKVNQMSEPSHTLFTTHPHSAPLPGLHRINLALNNWVQNSTFNSKHDFKEPQTCAVTKTFLIADIQTIPTWNVSPEGWVFDSNLLGGSVTFYTLITQKSSH